MKQAFSTVRGVLQFGDTLLAGLALTSCALALDLSTSFTPAGLQCALMLTVAGLLAVYAWGQLAPNGLRFLATNRAIVVMAVALHIVAFLAIASYIPISYTSTIGIYYGYGAAMTAGHIPFHNFAMEYPPLAAPLFWLPALVAHDIDHYRLVFALEMLCFDLLGVGATLWAIWKFAPRTVPWGVVIAQPLWLMWAGRSIVFERFDLAPAVLVLLAVALFADNRRRLAWLTLGLATALKLYPFVVVPLFVIMSLSWGRGKGAMRGLAFDIGVFIAAIVLPTLLIVRGDIPATAAFFTYQLDRGLEIETVYSSLLMAGHLVAMPLTEISGFGSEEVTAPLAPLLSSLAIPLTALALLAVYAVAWRRRRAFAESSVRFDGLIRLSSAAVLAFMVAGKVLSPQYVLWLYPLLAALYGRNRRNVAVWALLGTALLLGGWIYPAHWGDVVTFTPAAAGVLLLRNGILLALGLILLRAPRNLQERRSPTAQAAAIPDHERAIAP